MDMETDKEGYLELFVKWYEDPEVLLVKQSQVNNYISWYTNMVQIDGLPSITQEKREVIIVFLVIPRK
ncbi:hypothetical protein L3X38_035823 [Prunus dulcis]|uniref:Uncharacterized protein n=1 Tax=Prunus dulcis TaxID=3755 RepID=A0AAD4VLY6_PRUDU|nr:hypothetical protein L3X38_035823 [Prunus dulcis]